MNFGFQIIAREEKGLWGVDYNRGEKTNSTPPVSENPIPFEKREEDELAHVEDLAENECGGTEGGIWATVEESSNKLRLPSLLLRKLVNKKMN